MKILILQGGARKKGNTAQVLTWVDDELKTLGHDVETVYLGNKHLNGCLGCAKCKDLPKDPKTGVIGCIQKDDVPDILGKMVTAEAVVFSSPLYFWGVTAQLKAVIDRSYSLYTQYHQPDHTSLVEGQRQAILITGGGPFENNAQETFTAFSRLQNPHKAVHAGELFVGRCTTPANMDASVKQQAVEFAQNLVA